MSEHRQQDTAVDDVQRASGDAKDVRMAAPAASSMGGMQRAEELGTGTVQAGGNVLRGAVSTTENLGTGIVGGAAHIATGLVHGVTDVGFEVRNGATGLIGAVGDIGNAAINTVAGLLVDVVGGVRQVVNAAVHGSPDGAMRHGESMQMQPPPDQGRSAAAAQTGGQSRA